MQKKRPRFAATEIHENTEIKNQKGIEAKKRYTANKKDESQDLQIKSFDGFILAVYKSLLRRAGPFFVTHFQSCLFLVGNGVCLSNRTETMVSIHRSEEMVGTGQSRCIAAQGDPLKIACTTHLMSWLDGKWDSKTMPLLKDESFDG